MKCPNCGHENPDIRLFCARCGEILPEKDETAADKMPSEHESASDPFVRRSDDMFDDGTEFHIRRERARRVIEEAWPEANNDSFRGRNPAPFEEARTEGKREKETAKRRSIFDDEWPNEPREPAQEKKRSIYEDEWSAHPREKDTARISDPFESQHYSGTTLYGLDEPSRWEGSGETEQTPRRRPYESEHHGPSSVKGTDTDRVRTGVSERNSPGEDGRTEYSTENRGYSRPETYIPRREEDIDPDRFFELNDKKPGFDGTRRPRSDEARKLRPETYIPHKDEDVDPDNFFDVQGRSASFDRLDDKPRRKRLKGDEFEDSDGQSFAVRHMRGIVSLALLLFTLAIVVIWAITPGAQKTLAKLDLAWEASAYEELGMEAWGRGSYATSAGYFARAFDKDPANISYARYAAESWMRAENYDMAADALRTCIAADPNTADYYLTLIGIYYGYENLPEADRLLINDGYRRTGDPRLEYNTQED